MVLLIVLPPPFAYAQNKTSPQIVNGTIGLKIGNDTFPIKYQITGDTQVKAISVQKDNTTLLIDLAQVGNNTKFADVIQGLGKLRIELPRNIIDSKNHGNIDEKYVVFLDGQNAAGFDEIKNNNQVRILEIPFDKGSEVIEIAGTHIVPEFSLGNSNIFTIALFLGMSFIVIFVINSRYCNKEQDSRSGLTTK